MKPERPASLRWLRISRKVVLVCAALPMLQFGGCGLFGNSVGAMFANALPATIFNVGLNLAVSILTGTANFFFQSGGFFGGGF
jgi:hypothetical protein